EKPVGTVWIGFAHCIFGDLELVAEKSHFHGAKDMARLRSANYALGMLRRALLKYNRDEM
ncbi:MAG: hypothetical protein GX811_08015, partial [Lentisphaerae bacterium]|nr:hypothetical protein [Lentisphaerota bacterium]